MKSRNVTMLILVTLILLELVSCKDSETYHPEDIEGVYEGLFTTSYDQQSALGDEGISNHGTAEVTLMDDSQIEVHCYGEDIDTTFMLGYFQHNDSVMVCLSGTDFENFYGHMPGRGHMSGGMMSDIAGGETEWMHHLSDEHSESDQHFGGFDMHEQTMTYSLRLMEGSTPYYLKFHGTKQ